MSVDRPAFDVVIVGYRRPELLATVLESLAASDARPARTIVIDNESDPVALAGLRERFPGVRFTGNTENRGFAAASNQGFRQASAPFVLFLNPDVVLDADTLGSCVDAIAGDPSIGALTCRLELPDGRLDHACHRGLPTPRASLAYMLRLHRLFPARRWASSYTMGWADPTTSHDVEACSGAYLLVRAHLMRSIGGWDERFRFYAEDLDLCVRIRGSGARVYYLAHARAVHLKGATSHLRRRDTLTAAERAIRARVAREIEASHRAFFEKHYAPAMPVLARQAVRGWLELHGRMSRVRFRA